MSKPNNNALLINTAITTTFFLAPILYYIHKQKRLTQKQQQYDKERETERAFLYNLTKNPSSQPLRPPLPEIVRNVLVRCRFAYLSTMDVDANSSHLSLMRFTYLPEEEMSELCLGCWYCLNGCIFTLSLTTWISSVCYPKRQNFNCSTLPLHKSVVMSTNKYTKKYEMLEKQSGVALLIHDFSEASAEGRGGDAKNHLTGEYSITLNGTCSVIKDGERFECWKDYSVVCLLMQCVVRSLSISRTFVFASIHCLCATTSRSCRKV